MPASSTTPPPAPGTTSPGNAPEWSVSDLAAALKRTLEDSFGHVRLRGEISGYRGPHSSGHAYFSLKDGTARIDAVVWRGTFGRLRQKPQEGLEVVATGRITTFPGKSAYQIVVESLEPAGIGAWMALLEERKKALAAEGLFDPARKRPIPYLPGVIGVVTSPTGAVIRDILHRLADRFPRPVLVWPVRVQGEGAAAEIAAAIAGFNALTPGGPIPRPDVILVARGGGSIEDLWAFNEEAVVRAAAASAIPLISAVGHETDTTLIDFAADRRAPTPTGAAEMAVPVRSELLAQVDDLARRQRSAILRRLERERGDLRALLRAMPGPDSVLGAKRQRLDLAEARLVPALGGNARRFRERLSLALERLSRRSPDALLARARSRLAALGGRPETALRNRLARRSDALQALGARLLVSRATTLSRAAAENARARDRVVGLGERLERARRGAGERRRARLDAAAGLLRSLSYRAVLARGFALVRDETGASLRRAAGIEPGRRLSLEFADGILAARSEETGGPAPGPARPAGKEAAGDAPKRRRARGVTGTDPQPGAEAEPASPGAAKNGQGSLF